ncbi:MAG: Methyltransferase [Burkholderiales bacterium]|jgi:trans-aconitate methyltransferase|nr:Methyltransferase [Burkholderiales bacterium]
MTETENNKHDSWNASDYSVGNNLQYAFALEFIHKIPFRLQDFVMDIGSGDGRVTCDIAKLVCKIVGIDQSADMIRHAKLYSNRLSISNVDFLQTPAEEFGLTGFNKIISFNALHWVFDQVKVLKKVFSALVNNGEAYFLMTMRNENTELLLDQTCKLEKWQQYFSTYRYPRAYFETKQYESFVLKSGLIAQYIREKTYSYTFSDDQGFKLYFKSWLPHLNQIPEDMHDGFLNDLTHVYQMLYPKLSQAEIILPLRQMEICLIKP